MIVSSMPPTSKIWISRDAGRVIYIILSYLSHDHSLFLIHKFVSFSIVPSRACQSQNLILQILDCEDTKYVKINKFFHYFCRMAGLSADSGGGDEGHRLGSQENSLRNVAKRANHLSLPGMGASNTRSLFIFSEENFIRKYARLIIEWGYPFK